MSAQPRIVPAVALEHVARMSRAAGENAALLALRERARDLLSPLALPDVNLAMSGFGWRVLSSSALRRR